MVTPIGEYDPAMLPAVATSCAHYDSCWHPVQIPAHAPFGSPAAAMVWMALLLTCLIAIVQRIARP